MNLSVKDFWKSASIWRSYGQDYSGLFFIDSQCTINHLLLADWRHQSL